MKSLLAFDFGTSYLKAVIFVPRQKTARIIATYQASYNPESGENIKEKIKETVLELKKYSNRDPELAIVGVGGGMSRARVGKIFHKRKSPSTQIKKSEIERIVKNSQERYFREAQKEFGNREIVVARAEIKKTMIDSWILRNPVGIKGERLFLKLFNFYIPKDFYENIEGAFDSVGIKIFSFCYIPEIFPEVFNLEKTKRATVFVDIGGRNTEIFLLRENELEIVERIEKGGDDIFSVSYSPKFKKLSEMKRLVESRKQLENYKEWQEKLFFALWDFSVYYNLSKEIYLLGGGSRFLFSDKKFLNKLESSFIIETATVKNIQGVRKAVDDFRLLNVLALSSATAHGNIDRP